MYEEMYEDDWNSEEMCWVMFDAVYYGPTTPWEHGFVRCKYDGWVYPEHCVEMVLE